MQVFGIREKQTKYSCCDCGKKLSARAKTPAWRKIPASQKRCRSCSARYRGFEKYLIVIKEKVLLDKPSLRQKRV